MLKKISRNNQLISKKIKDELVLLDIRNGKLYRLNDVAEAVWKFAWKKRTLKEIVDRVTEMFDGDKRAVEKDVLELIKSNLDLFNVES